MVYRKYTSMIQNIGSVSIFNRILFCIIVLVCCYPYSICGDPYKSAEHYWPMCNITDNFLEDKEGAAHTIVYGAKIVLVPQLGHALSLDGKDDWVDTGKLGQCSSLPSSKFGCGFNGDCVTEPSSCQEGFTVTFWLKVYSTGYIMSSGSFTNHRNGPGFQLFYHQSLKRFKFVLETRNRRWMLLIHEEVGLWTHMAFTWHNQNGLRYYEDGNLSTFTDKPELVSPLRQQNYTPVITLARPSELRRMDRDYGKFDISQLAIWVKALSAEDVAGVYEQGVTYDANKLLCCHFKRVSPCVTNPCHDVDECRRISESPRHKCICPAVSLQLKTCKEKITGECEDKSTGCKDFAAQSAYCKHRKMRKICPRSCNYCGSQRPSTTVQPTLSTGSTSMSRIVREPKDSVTLATSSSSPPPTPSNSMLITYGTTHRRRPKGRSCQCEYYEQCVQTNNGYAECRCQKECNTEWRPVCGTNDKTYLNMCVLKQEACHLGKWIGRKHHDVCGVRFKSAVHYLPMNGTTAKKKLVDMRGNVSAEAHNGVKTSTAEQLGAVLTLNGRDNTIELRNLADTCIGDPTECTEGLSVAFWIRYAQGEFIISSGEYTSNNLGPGFRFICENCAKKSPHVQSSGKFLLELSTSQAKWKIHLDSIPCWWFHFAFTWNRNRGLKFYENGRLAVSNSNPVEISGSGDPKDTFITIGKPNLVQSLLTPNSHGNFSIAHLVIWTHELSAFDVEVAFLTVPTESTNSLICCKQMEGDPCVEKPYHDGRHDCQRIADKHKCICTNTHTKGCSLTQKLSEKCEDQTPHCQSLAKQKGFCEYHRHRMKQQCPRSCDFCGNDQTPSRSAEVLSSDSSLKVDSQIMETTKGSYSVEKALQTENRNIGSTRRKEDRPLQSTQFATETVSNKVVHTSFIRNKNSQQLSTFNNPSGASNTGVMSPHFRFSLGYSTETNMVISTTKYVIVLSSSSRVPPNVAFTTDTARDSLVLPAYVTSLASKLHIGNSVRSKRDITSRAEHQSKSAFLSHYSTGVLTQAPGFSTTSEQLPLQVSSTFTSSSVVSISTTVTSSFVTQISTTLINSTTTAQVSPRFTDSFDAQRISTSFELSSAFVRASSLSTSSSSIKSKTTTSATHTFSTPHILLSRDSTASSLTPITSAQPVLSISAPTQENDILRCKINNSTCVCFNCEEARRRGIICCMDLIDIKNIQHGVTMNMTSITVKDFYSKVGAVSRIIGEVVLDSCRENASLCVTGERFSNTEGVRGRRSPEENTLRNNPSFDTLRTKREALRPDKTSSRTNFSHVDVIIYRIASKAGHPANVQTDFYASVTSLGNGTYQTSVIDGKCLLQILRDNKRTIEDKLNITIDSFAASQKRVTTTSPRNTLMTNPSPGSHNMQTPLSSREAPTTTVVVGVTMEHTEKKGMSQGLLILIICVGCAGLVLVIVVMAFILTRFYKQRKGEFVPDKNYPDSHDKQNGDTIPGDYENVPSIIDPSAPRITDVPHKPSRAQAAGGGGGGGKKQRKPMGVKVTYKPPEWD